MAPKSLVTSLRDRYLSTIRSVQPPSRWKVLVVDSFTKELLQSVLKMYDILQENVAQVDNIELNRAPQSTLEACYLLTPTSQNVDRIIRDLAPSEPGKPPTYAAGHIFFVDSLSDALVHKLTSSPAEPKLRQLLELYTNFWPLEAQVFSLKSPHSFLNLFQPVGGLYGPDPMEAMRTIQDELQFSTQAILNVCVTLNEFPLIRYYNPSHPPLGPLQPSKDAVKSQTAAANMYQGSARMARLRGGNNDSGIPGAGSEGPAVGEHFTRKLALSVQAAIDQYVRDNEPKMEPSRPRSVLFITDRSMDTVAPFLHEFSYQAMCNDLLAIEDGLRYNYTFTTSDGEREDKEAILSDEDNVWTGIRHLHIAEAIDKLTRDFKQHAGEQGAFADPNSSLNDMRDMLASLPHMQEMKEKLSLHLTMAQECMNRFEKSKLPAQAMVEQNCATRLTPEGQKPKTLVEEMVPLLDDRSVTNIDKVRIIALYIMYCDGVPDEDRKRLFQHARLGRWEMEAVDNLVHLGAQVVKDPSSSGWDVFWKKGKRKQQPVGGEEYELSRYQPLVKLMVEDHFAGRLEQATYPYVRDAPVEAAGVGGLGLPAVQTSALAWVGLGGAVGATTSSGSPAGAGGRTQPSSLRSAKPTWHQKGRAGSNVGVERVENRQRVMVFVAGGMTYSEMRSAYQMSEKLGKDVYIGSSNTFTPESFVEVMKHFGKAGARDAAMRGSSQPHHHHQKHHQQEPEQQTKLPSGASKLSKPANDRSAIRTTSLQHGAYPTSHSNGGGVHHTGYAASPISPVDQSSYDRRFQTHQQTPPPSVPPVAAQHASSIPPHLTGSAQDGRSASPAPSQASDLSMRSKEKKRLKNVFGFKKS